MVFQTSENYPPKSFTLTSDCDGHDDIEEFSENVDHSKYDYPKFLTQTISTEKQIVSDTEPDIDSLQMDEGHNIISQNEQ